MTMTQSQRVKIIITNFEDYKCIFGCDCKVETIVDVCNYRSYKCPKCGKEYTAKSVFEAIKRIYSK